MAKRETLWFRLEYAAYRCNVFDTYLYVGTAHMAERYVEGFFFLVFLKFFLPAMTRRPKVATRLPRGYEGLPAIGELDGWMDGDG